MPQDDAADPWPPGKQVSVTVDKDDVRVTYYAYGSKNPASCLDVGSMRYLLAKRTGEHSYTKSVEQCRKELVALLRRDAITHVVNGGTVDPPGWRSPEFEDALPTPATADGEVGAQVARGGAGGAAAASAAAPAPVLSRAETSAMAKRYPKVAQFVRTVQIVAGVKAGTYHCDTRKYLGRSLAPENDRYNRAEPKKRAGGAAAGGGGASVAGPAADAGGSGAAAASGVRVDDGAGEAMETASDAGEVGVGGDAPLVGAGPLGRRDSAADAEVADPNRPRIGDPMPLDDKF